MEELLLYDSLCAKIVLESLALDFGESELDFMKNKKSKDMPVRKLTRVADFLPPPHKLLPKEEVTKITLSLDKDTVAFFKQAAGESGEKYQRMMRQVLSGYAIKYRKGA